MPSRSRGAALIYTLLLSSTLLLLCIAFMVSVQRDTSVQRRQELQVRAQYLALSGLDWFTYQEVTILATSAPGTVFGPFQLGAGEFFQVTKRADGGGESRGWLEDASGRELASRTLIAPNPEHPVPGGDRRATYDADL